jgi:dTDP-4-dehydrorhamnose 3,5-epimerase
VTYVDDWFSANVARGRFVQDNHSFSKLAGTLRGIHFQLPPHAQGKLVRVTRGAIWDVAIDLRTGSPTFGRHVGIELSAANWQQLWIPVGFGHAFCTIEPGSEVFYKVTAHYQPDSERGIAWDDPDLGIDWPVEASRAILSDRDRRYARLKDCPPFFHYEPNGT